MNDDQHDDDQRWLNTVLKSFDERSDAVKQALVKAVQEREGAGPLLGLELTDVEKSAENQEPSEDSNQSGPLNPLLGTNISEHTETVEKSSRGRSPKRVCYDSLLRFAAHNSDLSIRQTVRKVPRGCYGFLR